MHKQAAKTRKSEGKPVRAPRAAPARSASRLTALRHGAEKAGTLPDGATMSEILGRAVQGNVASS